MKKIVGIINMLCIAILLYSCAEESVGQTPVDNMPSSEALYRAFPFFNT